METLMGRDPFARSSQPPKAWYLEQSTAMTKEEFMEEVEEIENAYRRAGMAVLLQDLV